MLFGNPLDKPDTGARTGPALIDKTNCKGVLSIGTAPPSHLGACGSERVPAACGWNALEPDGGCVTGRPRVLMFQVPVPWWERERPQRDARGALGRLCSVRKVSLAACQVAADVRARRIQDPCPKTVRAISCSPSNWTFCAFV